MKLYNSLSQTKEEFISLKKTTVTMYVCGITPYDTTHLGHAFTYIAFDILQRYLTFKGYTVTYTQNVTDIDDDILKKAKGVGKNWEELGEFWTKKFLNDLKALNVTIPTYYVKATDSISTMLEIIEELIKKAFAYEKEGNIYFRVNNVTDYGKLSRYTKEEMIDLSKKRGANPDDPLKENPLDFVLWQKSKQDEPSWKSPWGNGRPGWHIECSAMINKYLGTQIDIHGGGSDLLYPHHESEIAQSENVTGKKPFVKYWMHTGAVMFEGEKMSKSLGNLVMISDLLKDYSANAIRFVILSHHYRIPWEFYHQQLETAKEQLTIVESILKEKPTEEGREPKGIINQFTKALDEDLDTPKALEILQQLAKQNVTKNSQKTLREMFLLLGFSL